MGGGLALGESFGEQGENSAAGARWDCAGTDRRRINPGTADGTFSDSPKSLSRGRCGFRCPFGTRLFLGLRVPASGTGGLLSSVPPGPFRLRAHGRRHEGPEACAWGHVEM